jgi:hypothetical protein
VVGTTDDHAFATNRTGSQNGPLPDFGGQGRPDAGGPTSSTSASDVDEGLIVGRSARVVDDTFRAFVYDATAATTSLIDLPADPSAASRATAVSHGTSSNPGLVVSNVGGQGAI